MSLLHRFVFRYIRRTAFLPLPKCTEVFRALEQKAVYGPMMVIFIYNLFQVRVSSLKLASFLMLVRLVSAAPHVDALIWFTIPPLNASSIFSRME